MKRNPIAAGIAAILFTATLSACGGGGGSGYGGGTTPTPSPAPAPTPAPAPYPTLQPSAIRFAPYIDVSMGTSITGWSQATGKKFVTLAFYNSSGACEGTWPGIAESELLAAAQNLQAQGGQVIISTGGWNGRDLPNACTNATSVADAYEGVLNRFNTTYLDVDPETGTIYNNLDRAVVDRRSAALKILQDRFTAAGKFLHLSFTLAVTPGGGLGGDTMYVLQSARAAGVVFDVLNPMIMDYGDGVSQGQMGARSILALQAARNQLKGLVTGKTDAEYWAMMGATAMIGQNDAPNEVFTLADAQKIVDFAQANGMARLSFWALSRDNGSCPGKATADASCSGITQNQWAYTNTFGAY